MSLTVVETLAAPFAYGLANVVQSEAAQSWVGRPAPSVTARVRVAAVYAVGLLADLGGFALTVLALRTVPLFAVQAAVCSAVFVSAVLARLLFATPLRRAQVAALVVNAVGLTVLALGARESRAAHTGAPVWVVLGAITILGAGSAAAAAWAGGRLRIQLAALAAGLGFAAVAVATRVLHPTLAWHELTRPLLWVLVINAVLAAGAYGAALAHGRLTEVAVVTFAVEIVVPAVVGVALLGDRVRPGWWPAAVLGLAATLGSCAALARRPGEVPPSYLTRAPVTTTVQE